MAQTFSSCVIKRSGYFSPIVVAFAPLMKSLGLSCLEEQGSESLGGGGAESPEISGWPVVLVASSGDPGPVLRGWPHQGQPWRAAGSRKPLTPEHI